MKRWIAAVLAVAALSVLSIFTHSTVELTGADMAMDVPKGWMALTRDNANSEEAAMRFGMTAQEAVQFMEGSDFYLVLYEPQTGAEIYVTIFGSQYASQVRSFEGITAEEMEQVKQKVLSGYPDWEFDSDVTEQKLGEHTFLAATMHLGQGEERSDNRQLYTIHNGAEIYIDLYAGEDGLREDHIKVQDALAESLQVDYAMHRFKLAYSIYVAIMVSIMVSLLIQFVGLAMTVLLHVRDKMQ